MVEGGDQVAAVVEPRTMIVLWTVKLGRIDKIVEWLFRVSAEQDEDRGYTVALELVEDEAGLPKKALKKLTSLRGDSSFPASEGAVHGSVKDTVLRIKSMKYGQSGLEFSCAPRAVVRDCKENPQSSSKNEEHSMADLVEEALNVISYSLTKQHENAAKVDEERCKDTVSEIDGALGRLIEPQEKAVMETAKAILETKKRWQSCQGRAPAAIRLSKCYDDEVSTPCEKSEAGSRRNSLRRRLSNFNGGNRPAPWCKAEAVIHTSAKRLLAYLLNFDSIERMNEHRNKHGRLSRCMHVGGQGGINDARHLFYCVKVPKARKTRRFEVRAVWEKDRNDAAHRGAVYRFAWCPVGEMNKENGDIDAMKEKCGFNDGSSILAGTRGICELREVADNVTELTMVRKDELSYDRTYAKSLEYSMGIIGTHIRRLRRKYDRSWIVVDKEVRVALAEAMRKSADEEQKPTPEQQEEFSKEKNHADDDDGWKVAHSPSPTSTIGVWTKLDKKSSSTGPYSIEVGEAEGIVDCSAEEAAAWFYCHSLKEGVVKGKNESNLAHFELFNGGGNRTANEKTFCTVKRLPLMLSSRKFITKHAWRVDGRNDSATVLCWPATDYDTKSVTGDEVSRAVTGAVRCSFIAKNIESRGVKQCRVTYRQCLDARGHFPTSVANKSLASRLLLVMKGVVDCFKRDEEVDNAALDAIVDVIKGKSQEYTLDERNLLARGREFFERCNDSGMQFKTIKGPDPDVAVRVVHVNGDSIVTGVASTLVDADVATCLAHEFTKDSREAIAARKSKRIVEAQVKKVNDHTSLYLTVRDLGVKGLYNRWFSVKGVWQVYKQGSAFLSYEDTDELDEEFRRKAGIVAASTRTATFMEPLPSINGIPQTRVTAALRLDLKGGIPSILTNPAAGKGFSHLSKLRHKFDQTAAIDNRSRSVIIDMIKLTKPCCSKDLNERMKFLKGKNGVVVDKGGKGTARTKFAVRATLEDVAAYLFDFDSRASSQEFGDLKRTIVERRGNLELLVSRELHVDDKFRGFKQLCEFVNILKLHVVDADTIALTLDPQKGTEEADDDVQNLRRGRGSTVAAFVSFRTSATKVKGIESRTVRLSRISPMMTKIELVTEIEFAVPLGREPVKGNLAKQVAGHEAMQGYFLNLVSIHLSELGNKDGSVLAEHIYRRGRMGGTVKETIGKCKVLKSVLDEFPWFDAMIEEILKNKLRTLQDTTANASSLTISEARKIGQGLAITLLTNSVPSAGIDE